MSAPPNLIHIKRKRGDEDAPVTYLQLEHGSKRQLAGSSWVYRRRIASVKTASRSGAGSLHHSPTKPVIQTSRPGDELPRSNHSPHKAAARPTPPNDASPTEEPAAEAQAGPQRPTNPATEPRRFHMSRSAMSSPGGGTILKAGGVSKKGRYGTAVFVERGKKKAAKKLSVAIDVKNAAAAVSETAPSADVEMGDGDKPASKKPLAKRPPRPAAADVESQRKPMPSVAPTQDMSKIAADMDQWVLHEIGLNLKSMEQSAPPPAAASPSRFKPKAPVKRFAERHPDMAKELDGGSREESMTDVSDGDDDDDDYVIEVYELAPSKPVLANIPPEQIGVLRFDTQEDMELFYGNEDDDDSDYDDDEDENAENHYTADYPEDEVDSEDEYDRHAYLFRNANASDDEEYDLRDEDEDGDEDMYTMEGDNRRDEDDVFQEKIRRYIRQHGSN
ncbi:hypothetical protein CkaCkLH20_08455 [Colletotrichum karsti]|uniref:Transcription factor Iwr1 domain-containing protein n=1 Tax=Colletotrichum karsti TaxID=1095194 RepID=A0A9P6I074_9PEZI|nr:uncharacterized protein CkaCkLH20_08455 [Colletotrichum karsti]KAF9874083.1 hypothetical protein CkaCkLH20_08455 [Colletotrichum karsti]